MLRPASQPDLRVGGLTGTIRVGYQTAYELGSWSLVLQNGLPKAYAFRAAIRRSHDFWSRQEPLDLVVCVGSMRWIWCGVKPRVIGGELEIDIITQPTVERGRP